MNSNEKKGIILAGGSGTRLHPVTRVVSKQLLPVYNKPMIYYPLSILINSGLKDILIITTPEDQNLFKRLLGNGNQWGVNIDYETQKKPEGIAQAFLIAKDWLQGSDPVLILGDNLFFGPSIAETIKSAINDNVGSTIFGYQVKDPERYGVIEFDNDKNVLSLIEKPNNPSSDWIATGLYIYDNSVIEKAECLKKSARGELEITDLNSLYLKNDNLKVVLLDNSYFWLDTGTHEAFLEASITVKSIIENKNDNYDII